MIDAIRSSSPANTSGKLGFDTPVHLRVHNASQSASGIPLTPTLAPTENEEAFIGSSPTPATRDPTPALKSNLPALRTQDIAMDDVPDIPSSPPEVTSQSPSPTKRERNRMKRNARRKSIKERKARERKTSEEQSARSSPALPLAEDAQNISNANVPEEPKENEAAVHMDERPPSRRTRSALSQSTDNDQNSAPATSIGAPVKPTEIHSAQSSASNPASRKRKPRTPSKPSDSDNQQKQAQPTEEGETQPLPLVADYAESSGDDLDVQIASQLSQDLGLAVDQGGPSPEKQSTEAPTPSQATNTKKRKRSEDDIPPTSAKERRRSTRLSTKIIDSIDLEDPNATHSQEADVNEISQISSVSNLPSAVPVSPVADSPERTPRRSARNSQRKAEIALSQQSPSPKLPMLAPKQAENPESPRPAPQSSRKPVRGEAKLSRTRSVTRSQSTRDTLSSAVRASQDQQETHKSAGANSTKPTEALNQPEDLDQAALAETIPDNNPLDTSATPDIPLVSTEEATDSQVSHIAQVADTSRIDTAMQMDVDTEDVPNTDQNKPAEPTTVTAGIQTESIPTPQPDTSDAGITTSLKKLLNDMKQTTLSLDALREIDDLLFNIRVEAHDASRRLNKTA